MQPIQPIIVDDHDVVRFKENSIVRFLLDNGSFDMNDIAKRDFPQEDQEQFAQLIGYSLDGFGDLSYVSDYTFATAYYISKSGKSEVESRIEYLEETLNTIREGMKLIVPTLFNIHVDDLEA